MGVPQPWLGALLVRARCDACCWQWLQWLCGRRCRLLPPAVPLHLPAPASQNYCLMAAAPQLNSVPLRPPCTATTHCWRQLIASSPLIFVPLLNYASRPCLHLTPRRDPMLATAIIASSLIGLLVGVVLVSRRQKDWLLAEMKVSGWVAGWMGGWVAGWMGV